ncbi:MAG: hypothetical protein LPK80_02830 [Bacteroidota bacterium]|nr:hypothetical protein [Bacteroidota bacterium]MDX5427185.1 hypothetical protein [Bacteroidota bacterium]MDX5449396.1 hypothetical protein [Bacteroidota bacterium]MDX5505147.1 hypothetical protein [Bacteroidota bacterium]
MNYKIASLVIYFPPTLFLILWVGWWCYRNGRVYLEELFPKDLDLASRINSILLIGYYLLNLGYVILTLFNTSFGSNWIEVLNSVSTRLGFITLLLGIIHFANLMWLRWLQRYINTH